MSLGPVEILCIKFPSNFAKGEIAAALKALVVSKMIRIIDILFIQKDENGAVVMNEVDDLDTIDINLFEPLISDISGLISEEDVQEIGQSLDNNSLAALLLFEHTWATSFRDAVLKANGELLLSERIPNQVIEELLATQAAV
jgi:Family of unknown function (DUF6325)